MSLVSLVQILTTQTIKNTETKDPIRSHPNAPPNQQEIETMNNHTDPHYREDIRVEFIDLPGNCCCHNIYKNNRYIGFLEHYPVTNGAIFTAEYNKYKNFGFVRTLIIKLHDIKPGNIDIRDSEGLRARESRRSFRNAPTITF
jgi:hypothetical protein